MRELEQGEHEARNKSTINGGERKKKTDREQNKRTVVRNNNPYGSVLDSDRGAHCRILSVARSTFLLKQTILG